MDWGIWVESEDWTGWLGLAGGGKFTPLRFSKEEARQYAARWSGNGKARADFVPTEERETPWTVEEWKKRRAPA